MTVTAGRLEWELGIKEADKARILREAEEYSRKLSAALNSARTGGGLGGVGQDAKKAASEVDKLAQWLRQLQGQFRSGRLTLDQYQQGLRNVDQRIQETRKRVDLTSKDWATLGATMRRVQAEQATLGGSTAQVGARVRSLVNEVRVLRNEWQRTGQHTEQTKARLDALQKEMRELGDELRKTDGGWERFNAQIAQLGVAGRSAEATIAGMEGRMSRLGLASQVQLGVQQQLVGQMYRFGPAGAIAANSLGLVGGQMGALSVGALAATGGVLAVGGAAVALTRRGIPQVMEFEQALRVLVASGEDFTDASLDEALLDVQEAAGKAGGQFARAEMATALAELVKAGVDATDAMELLVPGIRLASVTGQTLNETTTLLLGNLRQFNLTAGDAGRVADALAAADLKAAETARELSEGMAVVGPVAAAAGFEFEEVLAILVELSNKGMGAADIAATGLRSTLSALLDPTDEAREVLASLGVSLEDADGKARPLQEVLFELVDAFAGSEEAAQAAAKVFDTRAITAILNITGASEDMARELRASNGALENLSDTIVDENLSKALRALNKAMDDLAKTFAGKFSDDIATVANRLTDIIRFVDALSNTSDITTTWKLIVDPVVKGIESQGWRSLLGFEAFLPPEMAERMYRAFGLGTPSSGGRPATGPFGTLGPIGAVVDFSDLGEAFGPQQFNPNLVNDVDNELDDLTDTARTAADVFAELKDGLADADAVAQVFGNTTQASLEAAESKASLVRRAIIELVSAFDFDPASESIQNLATLLGTLNEEAEVFKSTVQLTLEPIATVTPFVRDGVFESNREYLEAEVDREEQRIYELIRLSGRQLADSYREAREAARLADLRPSEAELQAAAESMYRFGYSMGEATQRGIDAAAARQTSQNAVRGLAAGTAPSLVPALGQVGDIIPDDVVAAVEAGVRTIQHLNDVTAAGVRAAEERKEAERQLGIAIATRRFAETDRQLLSESLAQQEAEAAATRDRAEAMQFLRDIASEEAELASERAAKSRELQAAYEARARIVGSLADATQRGTEALEASGTETERLQRRIRNLTHAGFDPASEAVQRLVRELNELHLAAALDELREEGLAGISDFTRRVLELNGVLPEATDDVATFSDKLRNLGGNDIASGLADILDGIKRIGEAAGDETEIVAGLTQALSGAASIVETLREGDGIGAARSLVGIAGSALSQIPGLPPGLGQLATAAFDLGHQIVLGISDAFTGDSPAARAIREGLTPAIAQAFSTGILAGVRGQEGWREALEGNVKEAFLGALIQAFVNSAIIGAILQPLIVEFSKLLGQGNYDAARDFLASRLPALLNQALTAVDAFIGAIPPGLLPGTSGGSTASPGPVPSATPTILQLPTALVTQVSAPSWALDLNISTTRFADATVIFERVVNELMERGVTVNTNPSSGASTAAVAA